MLSEDVSSDLRRNEDYIGLFPPGILCITMLATPVLSYLRSPMRHVCYLETRQPTIQVPIALDRSK